MKIKTKSGFVCDVDERMAADWDFVDALVDCESDDATKRVIASRNCIKMLLGKEGASALAEHVKDDFDGKIGAIIDGGKCQYGIESTVIDMTGDVPMILRPGILTAEDFEEALGTSVIMDPALNKKPEDPDFHPKAPGMKYKHYAPKAPMIIFEGEEETVLEAIEREKTEREMEGEDVVVITFGQDEAALAAHELFAKLREADKEKADIILAAALPQKGVGFSVMNRMLKSAGFNIRKV